jgi:hypothetical protein
VAGAVVVTVRGVGVGIMVWFGSWENGLG